MLLGLIRLDLHLGRGFAPTLPFGIGSVGDIVLNYYNFEKYQMFLSYGLGIMITKKFPAPRSSS